MNEAETRAELIDPALKLAGWGVVTDSRVRREQITLGRLEGAALERGGNVAEVGGGGAGGAGQARAGAWVRERPL